jgi:hypothetical protein
LKLGNAIHVVELEHGFWMGRRRITLDGAPIFESGPRPLDDGGSHHELTIDGHVVHVHIRNNGVWFRYSCTVDGREIERDVDARPEAAGTGAVAVSSRVEANQPPKDVKRRDRFIGVEAWFKGER